MKRLFLWISLFTICVLHISAETTLSYVGSTPASGSKISSFDITLEFDFDNIVQELGENEYGISITGFYNAKLPNMTKAAELYEGDKETGVFLGRTLTSNVTGKSTGFEIGNTVSLSFPDVIPEKGKTYNLYISNGFNVHVKGNTSGLAKIYPSYSSDNLVLTFIGESGGSESLSLESTSLRSQQELDVLSAITYTFNNPVSVSADAKVQVKEGENVIATSIKWEQPNEKSVTFSFDNVELLLSHSYVLALPEGVVSMTSDSNQKNTAFDITLNGILSRLIELKGVSPENGAKEIISTIKASFDVPSGYKFYTPEGLANKYVAKLYQSEISDDKLLASLQGVISQGNTVVWDIGSISLLPATKYIFYVPEGQFAVYDTNNKLANEYSNTEINLDYTTPTIEEAGYAPMELGAPVLTDGTKVTDGQILPSISQMEIAPPNLRYEYDGIKYGFFDDKHNVKGFLYDISGASPVLVKEFDIRVKSKETATEYYNALTLNVNSVLYDGHEYRIEIPEGAFTIGNTKLYNYVRTAPFSINVKGATPTEIILQSTSIEDGAECSSLNNVVFKFNGELTLNKEETALLCGYNASGTLTTADYLPITSYVLNRETYVSAHAGIRTTGNQRKLNKGYSYTLTLPAGCLYVESIPEISNKEIMLRIKGVEAPPVVVEPEYVSLDVSYLDTDKTVVNTTSTEIVKGKNVRIQVPSELWEIASLMRYKGEEAGSNVMDFVENGVYTSSPINDNTRFEVALEYAAPLVFSDITTGIAELPDSDIQIFSEGDNIVVKGLSGGEFITVYTMAGIAVGSHETAPDKDTVNISAATGQTYIVRVQKADGYDYAAKIMH